MCRINCCFFVFAELIHAGAPRFDLALLFIGISRAAIAINSILNYSYLLRTVENQYRGRVFATMETLTWTMMMMSMMLRVECRERR